jgi:hypothetical protein
MAFTGNYICTSFKQECYEAVHNLKASGGHTFKLALYTDAATLNDATTAYSPTNEVTGSGYSAGGATLTNAGTGKAGITAWANFASVTFSNVTLTARGGLIYNASAPGNPAVAVLDFGSNKVKVAEDLVVTMPSSDADNAIVRTA